MGEKGCVRCEVIQTCRLWYILPSHNTHGARGGGSSEFCLMAMFTAFETCCSIPNCVRYCCTAVSCAACALEEALAADAADAVSTAVDALSGVLLAAAAAAVTAILEADIGGSSEPQLVCCGQTTIRVRYIPSTFASFQNCMHIEMACCVFGSTPCAVGFFTRIT